jgi:hypothetical protein
MYPNWYANIPSGNPGVTLSNSLPEHKLILIYGREPGLPDCVFSNQKSKFGLILESLRIENVGTFDAHLEYLMAICSIL